MLKMSDLLFEKERYHDPYDDRSDRYGVVTRWVARDERDEIVAYADTKMGCVAMAREYINNENAAD